MEARLAHTALFVAAVCSLGASYRTTNFIVNAPNETLAREIGDAAERYRADLAMEWLGRELPRWSQPCPITAHVGARMGAGGATSFMFDRSRPFGWRMTIQGSRERVLDSVLPHEVTHTIFATHFGRPVPRWADEGACTTVEHKTEKDKQNRLLIQFLTTQRGIAFNRMFAITEYPQDILPLYAQGYSLARYLIAQGGKRKFVQYVGDGMRTNDWASSTRSHYSFSDLSELQVTWLEWVSCGSPPLTQPVASGSDEVLVASAAASSPRAKPNRPTGPVGSAYHREGGIPVAGRQLAANTGAAQAPTESWYLQQRRAVANQRGGTDRDAPSSVKAPVRPAERFASLGDRTLSRPPLPQQPRQVILEWSRPPGQLGSRPLPGTRYDAPVGQGGTVRR